MSNVAISFAINVMYSPIRVIRYNACLPATTGCDLCSVQLHKSTVKINYQ